MMGEEKRSRADRMSTRFWKLHGRKGWNLAAAGEATEVHLACGTWDRHLSWKDFRTRGELKTKVWTNVRPERLGSKPTLQTTLGTCPLPDQTKDVRREWFAGTVSRAEDRRENVLAKTAYILNPETSGLDPKTLD